MATNILVHVKNSTTRGLYQPALFHKCIFHQIGIVENVNTDYNVQCFLKENKLFLCTTQNNCRNHSTEVPLSNFLSYKLRHPDFCPVLHISDEDTVEIPPEISSRGVNVGVATVLESSDGKILLTKRAAKMRTFPGVWVPPGGHVEMDENLEEAGLRELEEETGISFSQSVTLSSSILGLWESVFPPVLAFGPPKRHHIVVYRHVALAIHSDHLKEELKMNPAEVDACMFLSQALCEMILHGPMDDINCDKIPLLLRGENGECIESFTDISKLQTRVPKPDKERVSTGTRFAIELWLEKKKQSPLENKSNL